MKKILFIISVLLFLSPAYPDDIFNFKMNLKVPRVYDNMQSNGYRKYQTQYITGQLIFKYDTGVIDDIIVTNVINKTQKTSTGKTITYNGYIDTSIYPRLNMIGSNKTDIFKTTSICFYLVLEPSYNISDDINEDNSLYLMVACSGTYNPKKQTYGAMRGYTAGTIGCGCTDYGHISPTRQIGEQGATEIVDDVAAVFGNIYIKFVK